MPGVVPEAFGLPRGTAIRYERPAAELLPLLPSYAVLDSDLALLDPDMQSWMLPGWAQIWIRLTAGPISVSIGNRHYAPLGEAVMYGVTSRAMPVRAQGGITVVVDVNPLGWARFVAAAADGIRDRIVPLADLMPPQFVRDLTDALRASDHDLAVKAILDDAFARILPPPDPIEPVIAQIADVFGDRDVHDLTTAAERVGISPATLQRVCKRYFGFSPKLLMMRARFVRHVAAMLIADTPVDHSQTPPGYHNVPHFLRDANRFLGMTPRRFLAMDLPYLRAALRARRIVLGEATRALDPAVTRNLEPIG